MGLREDRKARARETLATRVERTTAELTRVYESAQVAGLTGDEIAKLELALDKWDEFVQAYDPDGGEPKQSPLSPA